MRYFIFLSVAYSMMAVLGALLHLVGVTQTVPDVALAFVLYVVFSRRGTAPVHACFALLLGYLCDVLGGTPAGLQAFTLTAVAMVGRVVARRIGAEGVTAQSLTTAFGSVVSSVLAGFLSRAIAQGAVSVPLLPTPMQVLACAIAGPLVFRLGRQLDAGLGLTSRPTLS